MSPSDLGKLLKPFVFLDIIDMDERFQRAMAMGQAMPLHPHSGIATVTLVTEGRVRFDDPLSGSGTIDYGGIEWLRAGGGVWHGQEMSPLPGVPRVRGYQLWLALPPELENGPVDSCYVRSRQIPRVGPAHVVVGAYEDRSSPVPAPTGINVLLVRLQPGEHWTYWPPIGHTVGWLALTHGAVDVGTTIGTGEMAVFESAVKPISLQAVGGEDAVFVLGSAVPHSHELHLGDHSVHTSASALAAGELRIAELGRQLRAAGDRRNASGAVPIFR